MTTARKPRTSALPDSALVQNFQIAHQISAPIWIYDIDRCRILAANEAGWHLWGAESEEELCARDMSADMSVTVARRLRQYQSDFEADSKVFNELWTLYPRGEPTNVMVYFGGYRLTDGRMAMICEVQGKAEDTPENLRSAEALLHTDVMIALYGAEGRPLYMNPAARTVVRGRDHRLDRLFRDASDYALMMMELARKGEHRFVVSAVTRPGARWFDISARYCSDAATGETAILVTAIDVSELKTARDKARYLADRDQLTGCFNRAYLQNHISALAEARQGQPCAILYFDVDRFKQINDVFGHETGDTVLKQIVARGLAATRRNDMLGRLGGDEFVLVLRNVPPIEVLMPEVERIRQAMCESVNLDTARIDTTVSMGIAVFVPEEMSFTDIMRNADLALYAAKSQGRNRAVLFDAEMGAAAGERDKLEMELKAALAARAFTLHYQPRVSLSCDRVVSVEALVRWEHPERGLVPPDVFIPICEETGMIDDLGQLVLETGFRQAIEWRRQGLSLDLSLNISPRQFNDERLMRTLEAFAADPQFPRNMIELEVTENVLIGDPAPIAEKLRAITRMGYRIAIDDFGTGYSNLSYISQFPLNCIKIDRSFIRQLPGSAPIVGLILTLSEQIGATAVAEGVETEDQARWLKENGCRQSQGYLHARPLPLDQLMDRIAEINGPDDPAH